MNRADKASLYRQKYQAGEQDPLERTDPEFVAIRDRLQFGELAEQGCLTTEQRALVVLVACAAQGELDGFDRLVRQTLELGVAPLDVREALYHCTPYIGFEKVAGALRLANRGFEEKGVPLPLPDAATVTEESRFADGLAVQKRIFGEAIDAMQRTTPEGQRDIVVRHLSAWCFGDFYTRTVLDVPTRELLTFCMIAALGGCEPQVKAHVQGNANVGNTKQMLVDALCQMLPHVGFPRTLNALNCVNAVLP